MNLNEIDALIDDTRTRLAPLEVPLDERERSMKELEVGMYPGDQPDPYLKSGRKEFEQLKTERQPLVDQVKRARIQEQEFRDRESVTGQIKEFGKNLFAPHELMPQVPTKPQTTPAQAYNQPSTPLQSAPSSRFHVDDGEIIDTKRGMIIPPDVFNQSATSEEKAAIERQLNQGGHLVNTPEPQVSPQKPLGMTPETLGASPDLFARGITQKMEHAQPGVDPLARYGNLEPPKPLSLGEAFEESGKAFLRGIGHTGGLVLKGIGIVRHEIDQATIPEHAGKLDDYTMFKAGTRASEMTERMFPGRADLKDNFLLTTVPQALGSSVLFYGAGAAGLAARLTPGLTAAMPGAVAGMASMNERAAGVDPEKRRIGLFLGGLLGATEGIPIADLFRRMNTATGGTLTTALKVGTVQAIEEAVQEGVQQLGENVTAKFLFEKVQGLTDDVASGMGAGGLVGFLTGAIMARKGKYGSTLQKEQPSVNGVPGVTPETMGPQEPKKPSGPMVSSPFAPPPKPKTTPPPVDLSGIPGQLNVAPAGSQRLIKKPASPVASQPVVTPQEIIPAAKFSPQPNSDLIPEQPLPPASVPSMEPSSLQPVSQAVTPEAIVPGAAPNTPTFSTFEPMTPAQQEEMDSLERGDSPAIADALGMESQPEDTTVDEIHRLAEQRGMKWDNDTKFMDLTERVTGKRHLDELSQEQLNDLSDVLYDPTPTAEEIIQERGYDAGGKPIAKAEVTLYRGEAVPDESKIPDYIKADPRYQQVERDVRGRWFTDDPEIAKWYQKEANGKGRITTLQMSKDEADQYRVTNQPDEVKRYSKDPEREYFVPKHLAASATPTDLAAHAAATSPTNALTEPTQPQKEAGNYQKGHARIAGLDISIENPQGSTRSGTDKSGKPWSITMQDHYGYIRGTTGKDKDHLDVFIKPGTAENYSGNVYVVDQHDPKTRRFDEHKIVLGADSMKEARGLYQRNYAKDWQGLGGLRQFTMPQFKEWLKSDTTKPAVNYNIPQEGVTPEAIEAKPDKAKIIPTRGPGGSIEYVVQPLRPGSTPETLTVPAELPKNAPPERRRSVFMGKDGQRFIEFADPVHAEMFDFDSKMKKAVRGEKDFDVEHAMARIRKGLNLPAGTNVGALSNRYRTEVLDASRRIAKGETYKAPAPTIETKPVTTPEQLGEKPKDQDKAELKKYWDNLTHEERERWRRLSNSTELSAPELAYTNRNEGPIPVTPESMVEKPNPAPIVAPTPNGQQIISNLNYYKSKFKSTEDYDEKAKWLKKAYDEVGEFLHTIEQSGKVAKDRIRDYRNQFNAMLGPMDAAIENLTKKDTPEALASPPKTSATMTPEEVANVPETTTRVSPVKSAPTDIERVGSPSQGTSPAASTEAVPGVAGTGATQPVLSKPRGQSVERPRQPRGERSEPGHGERSRDEGDSPSVREPVEPTVDTPQQEVEKVNPGLHDYRITDADELEAGGPKEKFKKNVAAIKVLKQLESEGRIATPEEQKTLVKYVGWGGLPNAFYSAYGEWGKQYTEIEELLTEDEWRDAKASTINAHYTDPRTIAAIYDGLKRMGVKGGRLLEPGMGTGNFFGLIPSEMHFKKTGVELDSLTARIAKHLYQHAQVIHGGFEETALPDNFFDVTVGNVPFADVKPFDKHDQEIDKLRLSLHDYFFAKAMKKLRPGGVMAYLTSRYTMDKIDGKLRKWIGERADFLGAVRLPNTAFKGIANTEVVTDIIFLKKREPGAPAVGEQWLNSVDQTVGGHTFRVNQYYQEHPEQIMGKATAAGSMYRDKEYTVESDKRDMGVALTKAMEVLPKNSYKGRAPIAAVKSQAMSESFPAPGELKNHAITIKDNHPYQKQGDKLIALPGVSAGVLDRMRGLIGLREATQDVLRTQLDQDYSTADGKKRIDESISALNRLYDKFVKKHGAINDQGNRLAFREDPDYPLLQAIEHYDRKTKKAGKADIFYKPTIAKRQTPTTADSPKDALMIAVNESNAVDFERMRELTGQTPAQLEQALKGEVFKLPDGTWDLADAYLSGNVRQKLRDAQSAAKLDDVFKENVEALEKVIPDDLPPSKIEVRIGAGWVPVDVYRDFIDSILKTRPELHYNAALAAYHIQYRRSPDAVANTNTYGTQRMPAVQILEKMLHSQRPAVHDTTADGKSIINEKETIAALAKSEEIGNAFNEWIWKDEERATRLSRIYNDSFNNIVVRKYDGKHLTLPGSSPLITLRPHQKDVIWRALQTPTLYIAHVVGAGKTFAGAGIAIEHRRLGLAKKPAFAVPNHLVAHWAEEIRKLYPAANVLMTTERDFQKENRRKLLSRIATGNWDAVVLAHSAFSRLPVSLELFERFMQKEIDALEQFKRDEAEAAGKGSKVVKEIEKAIKRLKTKLSRRIESQKKLADDTLFWEQLGIDQLIVDEADIFKNLFYPTRMTRVAGLPNTDSKRAFDMFLKTRHIYELNNGRGVVFMSGTPVSNTMAEAFTVQRYLMPDALESGGMAHFDAWARMFGREVVSVEMGPTGAYRTNTRFAQFVNVPELTAQLRTVMDVKTNEDLKLDIPPLKTGKPMNITADPPPGLAAYVDSLVKRAEAIKKKLVRPEEDNMLKICNDGRLAALDLRLKIPGTPDFPGSKVNTLVEGVANLYKGVNKVKGTQLIFLDLSTPKATDKEESEDPAGEQDEEVLTADEQKAFSSVYQDIKNKLVKSGIKKEEIAFIHDAKTNLQKQDIFDKMNSGELRVLIGSTEKMGAGTNVQQRLVAVHHADCPWRPRDLEQRDGRIIRQGNMFYAARKLLEKGEDLTPGIARHFTPAMLADKEVLEYLKGFEVASYRYATKKPSFDLYNWQTVESKARMISQVMSGDSSMRNMEDIDVTVLSAAEMKALAADDPLTMEKISVEGQVRKLSILRNSHEDGLYSMKRTLAGIPSRIAAFEADIQRGKEYDEVVNAHPKEPFTITIQGEEYTDRKLAGNALREIVKTMQPKADPVEIGTYRGLVLDMRALALNYVTEKGDVELRLEGEISAKVSPRSTLAAIGSVRADDLGAINSLSNAVEGREGSGNRAQSNIDELKAKQAELEKAINKPFQYQDKLDVAQKRYQEILEALGKNESASAAAPEPTDIKKPEDQDEDGGLMSERGSFLPLPTKLPKFTKEAREYKALRAKQDLIGFSSSDEDIEARVREAKKGLKPEGIWSRLREHSQTVWNLVSREFEHLPDTAEFSRLRTDLLQLAKYRGIAADQVQRDLAAVIKPLSRKQYDQFEWKALLSDLVREAQQERALPFGYTKEKVQEDLDRLNQVIERDPMVQAAWTKRQEIWKTRKAEYQKAMDAIGFDTSKKLTKDDYFRHQVLEHARERHLKGTGAKVRTPTGRGFLKARHGSVMDINANYVQAEFEVMAQMVYDTQVAKVIQHVDRDLNIRKSLEMEAKARNADAMQRLIDEGGVAGAIIEATMKDFRKRIGMHMGMARKALELDKHERISLAELAEIADDPDSPANLSARGVFKAISERKQYVRDLLAEDFKTWDQLVPDTHDLWQPREGNIFYMADSIPAQLAKALQEGMLSDSGLDPNKLRKVLAMGAAREQYVIPVEAKATLDDLSHKTHTWFVEANRHLLAHWKQLMLIAPRKVLRYNMRNLTGDGDALFVGNPRAFLKVKQAAGDLIPVIFKDAVLTGEAKEWANRGGYGTTLQWQELGDINDLKAFKATLDRESKGGFLSLPAAAWNGYWKTARLATDYREAIMRYATYLDYLEQMQQSETGRPKNFGASIPATVMALSDVRDRAFKMSNELLGAYDRVSVAGQTLRAFWIPFWSWCVPDDSEILTRHGWKTHHNLMVGEEVLTFSMKEDAWEWQPVQAINRQPFEGDLQYVGKFRATFNHRWPVLMNQGRPSEKLVMREGTELAFDHQFLQTAKRYAEQESILSVRDAAILGWLVTDGYMRWRHVTTSPEYIIYQKKPSHLQAILALVGEEGKAGKPHPNGTVPVRLKPTVARRLLAAGYRSKADLPSIVTRLSKQSALAMWQAMVDAEGSRGPRHQTFHQIHGPVLDAFQILTHLLGLRCNLGPEKHHYFGTERVIGVKGTCKSVPYSGIVWCPNTPNGTWVMRQNGKVVITGNSEVNATRYARLIRNADPAQMARVLGIGGTKAAMQSASFLIKLAFFWSMLQAWNLTMYGDDEDELRETNPTVANRPHILFGRGDDGKIRYLAGIGALGDLLSWFGLDAAPGMVGDVLHDRMTIGEAIKNVAKAPVNKLWQGITPTVKMPVELTLRESTYPDIFHPRPIQDRADYLTNQLTIGPEVGALRGKPGKPLYGGEDVTGLLVQRTDPKAGAYGTWQGIERKYLERMGKDSPSMFWRTPKGEALSNWSRSIKDGDVMAEAHWKGEYERLEREKYGARFSQSKMIQDLEKSLRSKAPLAGVTKAERDQIVSQLDSQEKRTLEKAEAYYRETILQVLPESRRRAFTSRLEQQHWLSRPDAFAPHELTP